MTRPFRSAAAAAAIAAALSLSGCGMLSSVTNWWSDEEEPSAATAKAEATSQPPAQTTETAPAPAADEKEAPASQIAVTPEMLVGDWVEPVPNMPKREQGYSIRADGTARSIGMATLSAKRWALKGDVFTLWGDSIGNGMTIPFEIEFIVIEAGPDRLVLRQGSYEHRFTRRP